MPLVQQESISSQPRVGELLFRPNAAEWWPERERPADPAMTEIAPAAQPAITEPTTERKARSRRRRIAGISLYELLGQTTALLGTLMIAVVIWAIGAYFTLRFLDAWGAQAKLGVLLATFGMTPAPLMLYWMTRSVPLIMTVIEAFLLPRWNWPWTPRGEQVTPSGGYRWLVFGAVLTPDVYTTAAGLTGWVAGVLGLSVGWSVVGAAMLGTVIAISPEKIGRRVLAELQALWTPVMMQRGRRPRAERGDA